MASLRKLQVYPVSTWYAQQHGFYHFMTTDGSLSYVHLKTNVPLGSGDMWNIILSGYAYGASAAIKTMFGFYLGSGIGNVNVNDISGGINSKNSGVYLSSDNYATLRICMNGPYYTGFILDGHCIRSDTGREIAILAANQNNTSGNYY